MSSISSRFMSSVRSLNSVGPKSHASDHSDPRSSEFIVPLPIRASMSWSSITSEGSSMASPAAEMMDEDNVAWGPPNGKKTKRS
ncbi:hypothetical protein NLI96_g1636 [Meripilus lineatus]|uniref:Uncharacterized protein n=1 Tax=Meripilus lineatus TaxID=2056292 RepID=A0AAD5VAF0_9APHY|nr:hypothetical protein NLI96_g1636 [Physisporinus lineatus]